MMDKRRNRR